MFITRECLFLFYNDTDTEKFRIHSLYIEKKKKKDKGRDLSHAESFVSTRIIGRKRY